MNELELKILDIIEKKYKKKYIGDIKVTRINNCGYKLLLYLGNFDKPLLLISADIDNAEDFLKFIEQELISRLLIKVQWFKGIKIYPEDEKRGFNCENKQGY